MMRQILLGAAAGAAGTTVLKRRSARRSGVGVGAAYGGARAFGLRPPVWLAALLTTAGALAGSDGPMTVLGVSDPPTWSTTDWVSDVLPHLAYGAVTAATLAAGEHGATTRGGSTTPYEVIRWLPRLDSNQ